MKYVITSLIIAFVLSCNSNKGSNQIDGWIWPMYTSRNNFMISIIEASTLKNHIHSNKVSEKLRNLGNTLKENDNPILIKIQLK